MINPLKLTLPLLLIICLKCAAQTALPIAVNLQDTYTKGTRTTKGTPGKNYWQNAASYNIKINFNPQSRNLSGTVGIDYTNNSPDTLKEIYFKLYPNLYKKGSIRNMIVQPEDINDGVQIQRLSINNQTQSPKQYTIENTNMVVKIPGLAPKQSMHFDISYAYQLNKTSHIRTGQVDSGAFFVAYFFPRVAVYDDIDGWNQHNYSGVEEFYNDFCHFDAEITVPGDYEVWATGNLKNASEVYNDKFVKRIELATKNDSVTNVITPADLKAGNITVNSNTNTWKFVAVSVPDIAFATANHYLWKSSSLIVDPKTG